MFKHFPFIHNHGDFVHLDALREWFRGVPSLDTFLKYKNDKAIVKDLHFTDEKTTVEYIDTTDDTKKEDTLCEYLTSDVYDGDDNSQFNKIKKIRFRQDSNHENWIDAAEKANGKERQGIFRSNVAPVYPSDSVKKYNEVAYKNAHFGFSPNGIYLYNDKDLTVKEKYQFSRLVAYPAGEKYAESPTTDLISNVGVSENGIYLYHQDKSLFKKISFTQGLIYPAKETYTTQGTVAYHKIGLDDHGITLYNDTDNSEVKRINFSSYSDVQVQDVELQDVNPFDSITGRNVENDIGELGLNKGNSFHGLQIGNIIVNGQIMYEITGDLHIGAGKFVELMFTPGSMGSSHFASNVYPKNVQCLNNQGLITSITKNSTFPLNNSTPTYVTIYNPSTRDVAIQYLHFTF